MLRRLLLPLLLLLFPLFPAHNGFAAIVIPQTGETQCYDESSPPSVIDCAGTGQDGEYQAGSPWPEPRFTAEGECITDHLTGLMWPSNGNLTPNAHTELSYDWGRLTWDEARDFAASSNLCGYSDWRLPTIRELDTLKSPFTIFDTGTDWQSSLEGYGFHDLGNPYWSNTPANPGLQYWEGTKRLQMFCGGPGDSFVCDSVMSPFTGYPGVESYGYQRVLPVRGASQVVAATGQTTCYDLEWYERCCDSWGYPYFWTRPVPVPCTGTGQDGETQLGVPLPAQRFVVEGACVTDTFTGLMWSLDSRQGQSSDWAGARVIAEGLELCGYDDWRVPNRNEWKSLVDYRNAYPALPDGHPFLNIRPGEHFFDYFFWSSGHTWGVDKLNFRLEVGTEEAAYVFGNSLPVSVWPVRGGALGDPATLSGHVYDGDGRPLAGALVYFGSYSAYTGAYGAYTIDGILPGSYLAIASLAGYDKDSKNLTFTSGAARTADFTLVKLPALTGRVVDSRGRPVAAASIALDGDIYQADSDDYGRYKLPAPARVYGVTVSRRGYRNVYDSVELTRGVDTVRNYTLEVERPASLTGTVTDAETGHDLAGANVLIGWGGPLLASSDAAGRYAVRDIPPQTYQVTVSKDGYEEAIRVVALVEDTTTTAHFALKKKASTARITSITTKYKGFAYYLAGSDLWVNYTATVAWGDEEPGFVRFTTSSGTYDSQVFGKRADYAFNVAELAPCTGLEVVAVSADGHSSPPAYADFTVMPPLLDGHVTFNAVDIGDGYYFKNSVGMTFKIIDNLMAAGAIPPDIPAFGKTGFSLRMIPTVELKVDMNGKAEVKLDWRNMPLNKGKVCGVEYKLNPRLALKGEYLYPSCGNYKWKGSAGFTGGLKVSDSWPFTVVAGPVPIPMYWKLAVSLSADASLTVTDIDPLKTTGDFSIQPSVRGSLGVGVDEVLAAEGWINGGAKFHLLFPDEPHLKDIEISVAGGATVYALLWMWEGEALRWDWSINDPPSQAAGLAAASLPVQPRLVPRNYLTASTPFAEQPPLMATPAAAPSGAAYGVGSSVLQSAVFPYSQPAFSAAGGKASLTWVEDDPSRSDVNRTIAQYARYDGSSWTSPRPLGDDGTADFASVSLTFADGTVVAAWEDVKNVLAEGAQFSDMVQNLEISTTVYPPTTDTWQAPLRLTANDFLDRSPKLAGQSSDNVMLVWVRNEGNDLRGNANQPNTLWYSRFNGSAWSAPAVATSIPLGLVKYTLAYDGSRGRVVLSLDVDGDPATREDLELYLLSYEGGSWGALTRLTNDGVADENPQLGLDPGGDFILAWLKGQEVSSVRDFAMEQRSVALAESHYSSNLAAFKLANGADGRLALVWTAPGEESGSDIFTALYDPAYGLWGEPRQLTFDPETESSLAAAFLDEETLLAVYNRSQLGSETPGTTDLCMLTNTLGSDIALQAGSLTIDPPNLVPFTMPVLSVVVENRGSTVLKDIPIRLYANDIYLADLQVSGPLRPGESLKQIYPVTPPMTSWPVTYKVVIDPDSVVDPYHRDNNTLSLTVGLADPAIDRLVWERVTDDRVRISARITNRGHKASPATTLKLRLGSEDGPLLATAEVPELEGGKASDVDLLWTLAGLPAGSYTLYGLLDEEQAIADFDRDNNRDWLQVPFAGAGGTSYTLSVTKDGMGTGTVTSEPAGIDCGTTCNASFTSGTSVTLTATGVYSDFSGWSGDCTGTGTCTVSMSSAKNVTATFNVASGDITLAGEENGERTITSLSTITAANFTVTSTGKLTLKACKVVLRPVFRVVAGGQLHIVIDPTCPKAASTEVQDALDDHFYPGTVAEAADS